MNGGGQLLSLSGVTVAFPAGERLALAVNGVTLSVDQGETLGVVGESGSGKSMTLRAIMGLIPPPGEVLAGTITFEGRDVLHLGKRGMVALRGSRIAMIFQDATSALNPVSTVGSQLSELLRVKRGMGRRAAMSRAEELLDRVGIPAARQRLGAFPHELSGGMRQRVMIAMALACDPVLVLADEPTSALDVTVQQQVLALLSELQADSGMALIMVSHDIGVISDTCQTVAVMYGGQVVEYGKVDDVLDTPRHPYTEALLRAVPTSLVGAERTAPVPIPGQPPHLQDLTDGCPFLPRCTYASPECESITVERDRPAPFHGSACVLAHRGER